MTERTARLSGVVAALRARRAARPTPIVPPGNVAGRALTTVIAIMAFLASLTLGAVMLVSRTADEWQSDISSEMTVQILPEDGLDVAAAVATVERILSTAPGVVTVTVVSDEATGRLLEPWLGTALSLEDLPVPRLLVAEIDADSPPDFVGLAASIASAVPEARLDDHRAFVARLVSMAHATVVSGAAILALVVAATVLTVVFATRGAMSGNRHIIEVLHFVGAQGNFIAAQFERHFLRLGLLGSFAGGVVALLFFALIGWWSSENTATPEADQITALFGSFSIGWSGYGGIALLMLLIAGVTALTSRVTVLRQLDAIDMLSPVER